MPWHFRREERVRHRLVYQSRAPLQSPGLQWLGSDPRGGAGHAALPQPWVKPGWLSWPEVSSLLDWTPWWSILSPIKGYGKNVFMSLNPPRRLVRHLLGDTAHACVQHTHTHTHMCTGSLSLVLQQGRRKYGRNISHSRN